MRKDTMNLKDSKIWGGLEGGKGAHTWCCKPSQEPKDGDMRTYYYHVPKFYLLNTCLYTHRSLQLPSPHQGGFFLKILLERSTAGQNAEGKWPWNTQPHVRHL